ncbi:MAG TPA: DUF192 domain-containing protein [Acidimicrobiia bacterium]
MTVAVATTSTQRNQGLQGVEALPDGLDGMLFAFDEPISTTFHMRNVAFPLDVWFFDDAGVLLGSIRMTTCPPGACPSYATPGAVTWALETPAGRFDIDPGSELSVGE